MAVGCGDEGMAGILYDENFFLTVEGQENNCAGDPVTANPMPLSLQHAQATAGGQDSGAGPATSLQGSVPARDHGLADVGGPAPT